MSFDSGWSQPPGQGLPRVETLSGLSHVQPSCQACAQAWVQGGCAEASPGAVSCPDGPSLTCSDLCAIVTLRNPPGDKRACE